MTTGETDPTSRNTGDNLPDWMKEDNRPEWLYWTETPQEREEREQRRQRLEEEWASLGPVGRILARRKHAEKREEWEFKGLKEIEVIAAQGLNDSCLPLLQEVNVRLLGGRARIIPASASRKRRKDFGHPWITQISMRWGEENDPQAKKRQYNEIVVQLIHQDTAPNVAKVSINGSYVVTPHSKLKKYPTLLPSELADMINVKIQGDFDEVRMNLEQILEQLSDIEAGTRHEELEDGFDSQRSGYEITCPYCGNVYNKPDTGVIKCPECGGKPR